jgi:hypothetical protein
MKRLYHGLAVLALCIIASSCGDPTGNLRGSPDRVTSDPSAIFIDQGATQNIIVRVLDEQGNELADPITDITVSPANLVTVTIDSSFLAGTDTTSPSRIPSPTRTQLVVSGVTLNSGFIAVTAGGKSDTIPVRVLPVSTGFDASFSNQAPPLGELVTLTAPAGFSFSAPSVVTVGIDTLVVTGVAGNTLTFLPGANVVGKATITHVVPAYAPALSLTFTTVDTIGTPAGLAATLSTTTPAQSQAVTMTAPAGFTFQPAATLTFAALPAVVNSRAPDGSSITFQVFPGKSAPVVIDSALVTAVPGFPLSLPTLDTVFAAAATPLVGTGATATAPVLSLPAVGQSVATFDDAVFTGADITTDGGVGAQYYRIVLAAPATLTISVSSDNAVPDLDVVLCSDVACSAPDFALASTEHDEGGTVALPAGTTYLAVVNFDGGAGDAIGIAISR